MVHLNGYVIGFGPRAQKSEVQTKQIAQSECTGGGGGYCHIDKTRQDNALFGVLYSPIWDI